MEETLSPDEHFEPNEQIELKKEEFSDESLLAGLGREKDDDEITTTITLVGKDAPLSPEEEKTILERLGKTRTAFLQAALAHPHAKEVHPQLTADTMNLDTANAVYKLLSEKPTTDEKELEVKQAYENYQAVREKLSRHNGRLVIAIAKRYRKLGIGFADLIMDGLPGKMKAIDTFNPEKFKNKFSTYATYLIQGSIVNGIQEKARTIRLPRGVILKLGKMRDAQIKLKQQGEDHKNTERISEISGISIDDVRLLRKVRKNPTSLDILVGEGDGESLGSLLPDKEEDRTKKNIESAELSEALSEAEERVKAKLANKKKDRETWEIWEAFRQIKKPHDEALEILVKKLHKTKERIRQHVQKVLDALPKEESLNEYKEENKEDDQKNENIHKERKAIEIVREKMDRSYPYAYRVWQMTREGKTPAEICSELELKPTFVKSRIQTFESRFQKALQKLS